MLGRVPSEIESVGVEIIQAVLGMQGVVGAVVDSLVHSGSQSSYRNTGDLLRSLSTSSAVTSAIQSK